MRKRAWGLAAVAALSAACTPHPAQQSAQATATPAPSASATAGLPPITVRSKGNAQQPVRIVQQQGNRKIYELIARSTESTMQSQSDFRGTFSDTHVTFYGTDGTKLVGSAPVTAIDKAKQTVAMRGGVHAKTSDGIVLTCDQLEYNRGTGKLHGTGNVHIVSSQGYTLSGSSFTSDLKLTQVHME